jgi:hypothetical protein
MNKEEPKILNNDEEIAAGRMFRYTRSCQCGEPLKANELPMPTECAGCLAARPSKNAPPAPAQ